MFYAIHDCSAYADIITTREKAKAAATASTKQNEAKTDKKPKQLRKEKEMQKKSKLVMYLDGIGRLSAQKFIAESCILFMFVIDYLFDLIETATTTTTSR